MRQSVKRLLALLLTLCLLPVGVFALENGTGGEDTAQRRDFTAETDVATYLKRLGLFEGDGPLPDGGTDFALERAPSRLEALILLLALTGKKAELNAGTWPHPFTDVPAWADKYVGYAYAKSITGGVSDTRFGTEEQASAQMYLTFMLRALGYSASAGGDFAWDAPEELARSVGILPEGVALNDFLRADVVLISEAALRAQMKDGSGLLADALVKAGVLTAEEYKDGSSDRPAENDAAPSDIPEYDRQPITLATGVRMFSFTIVNVDAQTGMSQLYLSDGSYSGQDWKTTDKGWVKFSSEQRGLTAYYFCQSDVDFENVPDLKIRYTRQGDEKTAFFGCAIADGGRYWMDEELERDGGFLMTPKAANK